MSRLRSIFATSALTAAVLCSHACAQLPGPGPAPRWGAAQGVPVIQGAIARFTINPMGEVDGFQTKDGTQVRFPPHMSDELVAVVKVGDPVSVQGFREYSGAVKAYAITGGSSGRTVFEHPPGPDRLPPHLRGIALQEMTAQGKVTLVLTGPKGEANGVMLEDGSIVRFPPHVAFQFAQWLQPGQPVAARGYGTQNQFGRALEAIAIGPSPAALQPVQR